MNEANDLHVPWQVLVDQIHSQLQALAPNLCLLWVDPAQADPFKDSALVEPMRVTVPIRHPRFDPLRAPYLVPLDLSRREEMEIFELSVELAYLSWSTEYLHAMQGQPICGWVSASTSAKDLAGHWARRCHLHIQPRSARLLRFQDPGVREWLWPILNAVQQDAMLGPAVVIYAIGRGQILIQQQRKSHCEPQSAGYPKLELIHAQWDQVDDYEIVHSAWLKWCDSAARQNAKFTSSGWERDVLGALAQATRFGIRDVLDRELFALHALQLGAQFHQRRQLQAVWQKTMEGDFYGTAIEEVTSVPADQLDRLIQSA